MMREGDTSIGTENPFIVGSPIIEPQYFYGRQQEIQTIFSRLKSATPESSAIIGGRRIGKTSLLRILCHPHVLKEHGLTDEYIFVYLYLFISAKKGQPSDVETQLWQLILQGMRPQLPEDTPLIPMIDETLKRETITFNDFKGIVAATHEAGLKVILLFDEFRHVVGNEAFKPELFGGLRHLIQSYNLAFVTASGKNLRALAKTEDVAVSPFWNVFTNAYLKPFNKKEAHDLVTGYTQKTDISFTAEDFDYVMRTSGGHPYFLQLACWYVFDAYREGKWEKGIDQEKVKQGIEDKIFRQAEQHFAYYWEHSTEGERQALITLAYQSQKGRERDRQHEEPTLQSGPGLKSLSERGLIIKTASGNYRIFSPLFAKWILSQQEGVKVKPSSASKKALGWLKLGWFRKVVAALAVILFMLSAILVWPDIPDLARKALNIENVTPIVGLRNSDGEEVQVKVYSPKLLFVGETDTIQMQTYGAEEPVFEVAVQRGLPDIVITRRSNNAFEIECKGTNANVFSQSQHIELTVKATMPAGTPATAAVTVKTNHFLSLLVRTGVVLASAMIIGCLSVKKLQEVSGLPLLVTTILLFVLMLSLLAIGAFLNSVLLILLSLVPAGILLVLYIVYRQNEVRQTS